MNRSDNKKERLVVLGVATALLVTAILLVRSGAIVSAALVGTGSALVMAAGVTLARYRSHERELRDAVTGLENQTIVLEQQASMLGDKERQVRALNHDLEARVEQRTRELALANQNLEAANQKLEMVNVAKSEFLANMSHEIRTPMTAVLGYADLLLDADISAAERRGHVQTIRSNGEHLLSILNDILDLSKIDAGRMTVERIRCSPSRIVLDVVSLMRMRAQEKELSLDVRFDTPIPETISSDPTRLRQIVLNLVGNALKFTSRGSVWIALRCDEAQERLSFEIADTGIGMSAEQVARLFDPFTQGDTSTTRKFGGTGLGLAIGRRLARMLGGDIDVRSVLGRETSFTLTVDTGPLAGVRRIERPSAEPRPTMRPSPPATRLHGDVLVAEDGEANQILIATFLRKAGARVTIAANGLIAVDEALAGISHGAGFDVILMDMQMPDLDGYEATRTLRQRGYRGPILALTAHAMAGEREKCTAAGCDDYLTKPIQRGLLVATVARWIERARNGALEAAEDDGAPPISTPLSCAGGAEIWSELADDPDIGDLVPEFVGALPPYVAELRDAMASGALDRVARIAHQLKGSGGGYGFPTITDAAARLELSVADCAPLPVVSAALEVLCTRCMRARARRVAA